VRHNVTFRSTIPIDVAEQPIGCPVAELIGARLRESGISVSQPENYQDFAWLLEQSDNPKGAYLLVGYVGDGPFEWLAQVHSSIGWLGRRLGRSDTSECDQIAESLQQVLVSSREFSEVRWHEGEFAESGWTPTPS